MKKRSKALYLFATPLLTISLSGCAVDKAGCDPAAVKTAGFFTKLSCDVSGSYDARAQDQQAKLSQAQYENAALKDMLAQLEADNRDLERGITLKRAQRDRLVRSINNYLKQTEQQAGQNQAVKSQIAKAKKELASLQNLPANASAAQQKQQLQVVQSEIDQLRSLVR